MDIPENHIKSIWAEYAAGSQRYQRALEGALLGVQKGFSREGHYLFEFVQNAEDEGATSLECIVDRETVTVRNNGGIFQPEQVEALCDVGHSKKSPERYIGHLGVGFKSVFLISNNVEIHSGPYHFAFRRDGREDFPWQIAPQWVSALETASLWNAEFLIRLREASLAEKIAQEMGKESLNPRILLFLESLEELVLEDKNTGNKRVIEREALGSGLYELRETTDAGTVAERWLVYNSEPLAVPEEIRDDWFTKNWDRDQAEHRAVSVAFKLMPAGDLDVVQGTLHTGVFSYLPVREERSRLKFLVHADFLTSVGRTRIQDEAPWNRWLAGEVVNLVKKSAETLLVHPRWQRNALTVIWPEQSDEEDFFGIYVEKPLREFLRTEARLPAYDGSSITLPEALYVEDVELWQVIGPETLEQAYNKKPLAQGVQVPNVYPEIVQRSRTLLGNSSTSGFISSSDGEQFLTGKAAAGDVAFFKSLYAKMMGLGYALSTYRTSPLARSAIVLTGDLKLETPSRAYFQPPNLPSGLEQRFAFVHPDLAANTESNAFLTLMGIQMLPESTIRQTVAEALVPDVRSRWDSLSDKERRHWLTNFKGMVERSEVGVGVLDFLTVPTKSGKRVTPKDAVFPQEYSPEYQIETLVRQNLLDDPTIEFVAADLTKDRSALESWKAFLTALGVGTPLKDSTRLNRWSARVGVQMARRYEKKHGRDVFHEVTESERGVSDPGYDLESKSGSEQRFIEAKATRGPGDFTLRPTTLKEIFTGPNKDKFFVYVTSRALSSPRLHVIKADELTQDVLLNVGEVQLDVGKVPVAETLNFDVL